MDFKSAICPSCGGKLQLPDNLSTAKCMYCGVDVVVQDAIKLSGRVKEFTLAEPVEENNPTPQPDVLISRAKTIRNSFFIALFILLMLMALCVGNLGQTASQKDKGFPVFFAVFSAIVVVGIYLATSGAAKRNAEKMRNQVIPEKVLVAYKGLCPYCDSSISFRADILGEDCPVCHKRVVIRDSKFYSVDTPISGLK